uniref:Transposase Tc1-like domain-containing protein n=1 Tax=Sparus aurata TaxID=8175 RepID=A0A671U4G1_SPAAU
MGFHGRAAASIPYIRKCNAKRWMQWCKAGRHWTLEQWRCVLWSDESCFSIWQSDGRVWVWRLPGEHYLSDCIVPSVKFGGGMLMVWGCFPGAGHGPDSERSSECFSMPTAVGQFHAPNFVGTVWPRGRVCKSRSFRPQVPSPPWASPSGFHLLLGDNHLRLPGHGGAVLLTAWRWVRKWHLQQKGEGRLEVTEAHSHWREVLQLEEELQEEEEHVEPAASGC